MTARVLSTCVLAALLGIAHAADRPFEEGAWVEIKGTFSGSVFQAQEVTATDEDSTSVKGVLDRYDPVEGSLRIGGLSLAIDDRTRLQDADGEMLSDPGPLLGRRVKVSVRARADGWYARRVRLMPGRSSGRTRLEGRIDSILPRREGTAVFSLLGVDIRATPTTAWSGLDRPFGVVDDEDVRPADGLTLGNFGRFSGEVRFDYTGEDNFDLFDDFRSDVETGRARARLEWIFPSTSRMSGMLQLKTERDEKIEDEAGEYERRETLVLGRAYLLFHGLLSRHGSLQVGRSRFDDDRDWLYNRDIDALRFLFDFDRFHVEASIAQELVDPVQRHEDVLTTHLLLSYFPAKRHVLSAYVLDREDDFIRPSGTPRDFSPRLLGLRAYGKRKHRWGYWLEAAVARGSNRGVELDGEAVDAGVTLVGPWGPEPSLTLGYAFGSGDDDPTDSVDRNFRQSGLQLNNGKWNGVTNFRYYGELVRPELSNLHIQTIGIGFRPRRRTSIDLVYHRYELDEPASELVDADVDDRRLNLVDRDLGEEWDLIFGYEELKHWEFEVNFAYYEPGPAFLGPTDPASMVRLKVKYIF